MECNYFRSRKGGGMILFKKILFIDNKVYILVEIFKLLDCLIRIELENFLM